MLLSTAEEVPWKQKKKIQPLVTNNQRRQLRQQKYTSIGVELEYGKVSRQVRKKMNAIKGEWTEKQCNNIEKGIMAGNSKEAYNILRDLTKTQQHKSAVIEGSGRNILTEVTAVLSRWTEYCSGLHNYELHPDTSLLTVTRPPQERLKTHQC